MRTLMARQSPLAPSATQLRLLRATASFPPFEVLMEQAGLHPLRATGITVFQINVGKLCNQTCRHCHVDAGPDRGESMSRETAELCVRALAETDIPTVDITGGAPELNPNFRWLVEQAHGLNRHVMDRCNLSVLLLPSQADLADRMGPARGLVLGGTFRFSAVAAGIILLDGGTSAWLPSSQRWSTASHIAGGTPARTPASTRMSNTTGFFRIAAE